jgi:hypothetical protein
MPNGLFTLKQQVLATRQSAWSNQKTPAVDYLVVAGGGGGGGAAGAGGGGGAGGLLQGNISVALGSAITVTIGSGGAGSTTAAQGANGASSVFGNISTTGGGGGGGGGGGSGQFLGIAGGSGGGGGSEFAPVVVGGQGVFGQGNAGNPPVPGRSFSPTGGGGGAGTVGLPPPADGVAGNGGAGIASDISGTRTTYSGGGGGGTRNSTTAGIGGVGGGGAGGNGATGPVNGTANTGGGGGGGGSSPNSQNGGTGGSGVVIISYPDTYQTPTATTGSPTVSTSGSGSIAFNGTNQYLTYPSSTNYAFGTGDFTVEMYVYRSNTGAIILDARSNALAETWAMYCRSSTKLGWYTGPIDVGTPSDIPLNAWAHIAACRSGTTTRLFINGNLESSFTDITNYTTTSALKVGVSATLSTEFFGGNMSNIRITKGVALYTASFTPSAAPLSASASTGLLLNTVSGSVFADATGNTTISSAVNSPTWNQLSPFATGLGFKNRVYTWTSSGSITF